jgi:hypothetical protein
MGSTRMASGALSYQLERLILMSYIMRNSTDISGAIAITMFTEPVHLRQKKKG